MTVFVLLRQDQNDHGYVDTSVAGVYLESHVAREQEVLERRKARERGLIVEDDESRDGEWQVSWTVQEYLVS